MFRLLGRVLLAIAAGMLIYTGVTGIMNAVNAINALGGWTAFNADGYWQAILQLGIAAVNIIIGLPALFGFIRGKCGFWMFIFAAILGAFAGYSIYQRIQAGGFADAVAVWAFTLTLLEPLCYALGTIFILLRKRGGSD